MQFGLDEKTVSSLRTVFSRVETLQKVIIYGSRAKGNYKSGSDIDLTLIGSSLTQKTVYALHERIEELNLPYTFDISIQAQIDNPELLQHIGRVGKVFYERE